MIDCMRRHGQQLVWVPGFLGDDARDRSAITAKLDRAYGRWRVVVGWYDWDGCGFMRIWRCTYFPDVRSAFAFASAEIRAIAALGDPA